MRKLLCILLLFIPLWIKATVFYVAPTGGSDANPGTISEPWATWGKAFNDDAVQPGDTVYFRGGTYYRNYAVEQAANPSWFSAAGHAYAFSNAGEEGNRIYYLNYPGEEPILDDINVTGTATSHIMINGVANHCYFRGLTFQNCYVSSGDAQAVIWRYMGSNLTLENCVARNTHGIGFQVWGDHKNVRFINCDAYNHCDSLDAETPGNRGTGFAIVNDAGNTGDVYYENCRAWNCGDQGFSCFSNAYMEFNGCWSFSNGQMLGGGHGFKIGFSPSAGVDAPLLRKLYNCLAVYNRANGFTTNDNGYRAITCEVYNNLAYRNYDFSSDYAYSSTGFVIYNTTSNDATELSRVFRNNISYDNETAEVSVSSGAVYTHSNNSWDGGATITSADFAALPANYASGVAMLSGARQADGSLPDLGSYFKLIAESDAIDAGVDVGLPYSGDAPDLGAYEYNAEDIDSTATDILTFTLADQTGAATINTTNHTVSIEVDYDADITDLTPTITLSYGATVIPLSGVARDFTSPLPYTVTALDGITNQEWTVTVTQEASPPEEAGDSLIVRFRGKIVKR